MVILAVILSQSTPENVNRVAKLFTEYGDFIRSIIRYNIKNKDLTEDIYQDLFIYFVFRPIPADVRSTKGFLYKVITDKIKDSFRRIDSYQRRLKTYSERIENTVERSPDKKFVDMEEYEKMFTLIERRLPANEARAMIFKFRDNLEMTTIAEQMGIKSRSVSRYISVGVKKLRHIIFKSRGSRNDSY